MNPWCSRHWKNGHFEKKEIKHSAHLRGTGVSFRFNFRNSCSIGWEVYIIKQPWSDCSWLVIISILVLQGGYKEVLITWGDDPIPIKTRTDQKIRKRSKGWTYKQEGILKKRKKKNLQPINHTVLIYWYMGSITIKQDLVLPKKKKKPKNLRHHV
jgi:hypothetical protein